jgi:dsDNA-specific endonuclease/ATPase MutS2
MMRIGKCARVRIIHGIGTGTVRQIVRRIWHPIPW